MFGYWFNRVWFFLSLFRLITLSVSLSVILSILLYLDMSVMSTLVVSIVASFRFLHFASLVGRTRDFVLITGERKNYENLH